MKKYALTLAILAAPLAATADNEAVGTPLTAPPEIAAVLARAARCHDFISALPEGYQTRVGDGGAFFCARHFAGERGDVDGKVCEQAAEVGGMLFGE